MSDQPSESKFNSFLSQSTFLKPNRLTESAWIQHAPFAFWLIEQLRPSIFVELGVHTGLSYFSFCQSVKANNIASQCFGVDTWEGDEHAGFYPEHIWQDIQEYNTKEYSSFSTLLKTSFKEALPYFEDHSIGLLHIDGLHTYDAVKEDFDSWFPKLSHNAIVLFHDIGVRERGFGVYKLWNEIKQHHKIFEFFHGHGLGILMLGEDTGSLLSDLFKLTNKGGEANKLRSVYAHLGMQISETLKATLSESKIQTGNAEKNVLSQEHVLLKTQYDNLQAQQEQATSELQLLKQDYGTLKQLAEEIKLEHAAVQAQMLSDKAAFEQTQSLLTQSKIDNSNLQQRADSADERCTGLALELELCKTAHSDITAQCEALKHASENWQQEQKESEETLQNHQEQQERSLAQSKKLLHQLAQSEEAYEQARSEREEWKKIAAKAKLKVAELEAAEEGHRQVQEKKYVDFQELKLQLSGIEKALFNEQAQTAYLNADLARKQQIIHWYKRTYEDRSLMGIIKEKLSFNKKG